MPTDISSSRLASDETSESTVRRRYSAGALQRENALCCPIQYDASFLEAIPPDVLERDYGCGDPTRYVQRGDTVLDLGAGGGKVCFIAAQVVGPEGNVIGVDCNREMLALARRSAPLVAQHIGFDNCRFHCGMIQDLRLDLDQLAVQLQSAPVNDQWSWLQLRDLEEHLRQSSPMIPDASIDCVLSNCVLNLVRPEDRAQLFAEVYRVLRPGGRAAISDIVSDEDVPAALRRDSELWSGCISGAFREDRFLQMFEAAGFHGIFVAERQVTPWRIVEGIEFRSLTVLAHKGKEGPCLERNQALLYRGPFRSVEDDDGHRFRRGERVAVCDKTFQLLQRAPYDGCFEPISPRVEIPLDEATPFECRRSHNRHPRASKGLQYRDTIEGDECCHPDKEC